MFPRTLAPKLKRLSEQYPVVSVTGPRQSGKTTLTRMVFPDFRYVTLEDIEERDFATKDPKGFLARFGGGVILDEVQRAPDLFSSIQTRVDAERSFSRGGIRGYTIRPSTPGNGSQATTAPMSSGTFGIS